MKPIEEIISNSLNGEASEAELKVLEDWANESPVNDRIYQEILRYWHAEKVQDVEQLKRIKSQVEAKINQQESIPQKAEKRIRPMYRWGIAAAISLLLLTGIYWQLGNDIGVTETSTARISERINPPGQRSVIDLPDGSRVWLNADSKLSFPENFTEKKREVLLSGEAFFDVAKDSERPFRVVSANVTTTALGTSFNVRAFEDEGAIDVALKSGKIDVRVYLDDKDSSLLVVPGEVVSYGKEDESFRKGKDKSGKSFSWKEGIIQFDGEDVGEVTRILSRWYGVEFSIQNPEAHKTLLRHHLKAKDQSLEKALKEISRVADYSFDTSQSPILVKLK